MKTRLLPILATAAAMIGCGSVALGQTAYDYSKVKMEKLGRGLVAVRNAKDSVTLSWRYLSSDAEDAAFDIYCQGKKVNPQPLSQSTFYKTKLDKAVRSKATSKTESDITYELRSASDGSVLDSYTLRVGGNSPLGYLSIPLNKPADGVTPAGEEYTYSANDACVGDVDGDGRYEIILKWDPSNAHDNAHDGYTGNVLIDCYTLDGEQLWRIDLGKNIRAGAHYTQMLVYDFDSDGKAELIVKTADGTIDGEGNVIGDAQADYRCPGDPTKPSGGDFPEGDPRGLPKPGDPLRNQGRILEGPEYLTVFSAETGKALQTVNYIPPRGIIAAWGDERANRSDRFLAAVAYLDGEHPSAIMCRGYYTRAFLAAYDWDGKELTTRWMFDSDWPGNNAYAGQGNHNLRIIDVDADGCDEIIYGQAAIDHDGKGLYSTGMLHGDALHALQFTPDDPKIYVWGCHENKKDGTSFRDAATGEVIWQVKRNSDVGRCLAADIDPTNYGLEMWSSVPGSWTAEEGSGGIRNYKGEVVNPEQSTLSINEAIWWTGDLNRELLDRCKITKYNPATGKCDTLMEFEGCQWNNGTKGNSCLSADIIGDWREEVLLRNDDSTELRLYTTTIDTPYRFHTFLEDIPYRLGVAMQNICYNQPPQPGFYFGSDFPKGTWVRGTVIK